MHGGDGRFVRTTDAKAAVKGRETEALDALGIDWRAGHPHICCPYPDHPDNNPSWRWDTKRDRAHCTCIDGARKADDIFNVIEKVKRVDFETAKIIVAELLRCEDLIKTRGTGTNQRTDAQSLLNPSANNRDDRLPYLYLGARLGIDAAAVPVPTTKVVGIKKLAYFDSPAKKSGKPVLVGHWPSCVFEMIGPDARPAHAQRIYVHTAATGKADLGRDSTGKTRDPKKSAARRPGTPSTAGLCAAWGNPDTATVLLGEGIENACVNAFAFRDEVKEGELAVLSAITAGGIEAFVPWSKTCTIIVACDRDEGKAGAGFKRGERAARKLALRLAAEAADGGRQFSVLIALPGQPGTKFDFLDLFQAEGPDGVRNAIGAAVPFQPNDDDRLEALAHRLPLPRASTGRFVYDAIKI